MKALPKGVGAEPKKLALLGAVMLVLVVVLWVQHRSSAPEQTVAASTTPPQTVVPVKQSPGPVPDAVSPETQRRTPTGGGSMRGSRTMEDFHPSLKVKDDLDVSKVDPRIRQDLLAKVRAVPLEGGSRSLFEFSKAPEPPTPKVDPIQPAAVPVPPPAPVVSKATKAPAGPPPPPPIPFKYFGYAGKGTDGQLQGFFLEGDPSTGDIYPKREGDLVKDRYKIVRIGLRSAVVEDTVSHNQQTLPLLEEQQ